MEAIDFNIEQATTEQAKTCLVITRNQGQSFHIGEDIVVEIQRIEGKRASIKIFAPKNVKILRSEILNKFTS